jgi:hypothetical protein
MKLLHVGSHHGTTMQHVAWKGHPAFFRAVLLGLVFEDENKSDKVLRNVAHLQSTTRNCIPEDGIIQFNVNMIK